MQPDYIKLNALAEEAAEDIQRQMDVKIQSDSSFKDKFQDEAGKLMLGEATKAATNTTCNVLGNTAGKYAGGFVGGVVGAVFPAAEVPAILIGAQGGKIVVTQGCKLSSRALGRSVWKEYSEKKDAEKLNQAQTELSNEYERIHAEKISELTSNQDPASQAYIKDQYYRAVKQQPFYNILNDKNKNAIKIDQSRQRMNLTTKDASFEAVNKYHDNLDLVTEKYTKRISTILSNTDETNTPPSQKEIAENLAFLKEMQAENVELTHQNHKMLNAVLHEHKLHAEELKKLHESIKVQDKRHKDQLDKEQALAEYRGMEAGFNVIGKIGAMTGNETLGKIGTIGAAGVSIAFNAAMIAGTIPGMAAATGWGLMVPYAGIALAGLSIISALCSKKQKKDDSMMNAIRALSDQIESVRTQMHQRFDALNQKMDAYHQDVDNKLGVLSNVLKSILSDRFDSIEFKLADIQADLNRLGDLLVKGLGAEFLKDFVMAVSAVDQLTRVNGNRDSKIEDNLIMLTTWLTDVAMIKNTNGAWSLPENLTAENVFSSDNLRTHEKLLGSELSLRLGYFAQLINLIPGVNIEGVRLDELPNIALFTEGVNAYTHGRMHMGTLQAQISDPENVTINKIQHVANNAFKFIEKINEHEEIILKHLMQLYKSNYDQFVLTINQSARERLATGTVLGFEFPAQDPLGAHISWPAEVTSPGNPSLPFAPVLAAIQKQTLPKIHRLIQKASSIGIGSIKAVYSAVDHAATRSSQDFGHWRANHSKTSRGATYTIEVFYELNGVKQNLFTTSGLSGHVQSQTGTQKDPGGAWHHSTGREYDAFVASQNGEPLGQFLLRMWPGAALSAANDCSPNAITDNLKNSIIEAIVTECIATVPEASATQRVNERNVIMANIHKHPEMLGVFPRNFSLIKAMLQRSILLTGKADKINLNSLWDESNFKKEFYLVNHQRLVFFIDGAANIVRLQCGTRISRNAHPIIQHLNYCSQLLEALKDHESLTAQQHLAEIADDLQVDSGIIIDSKRILCDFDKNTKLGVGSFGQVYKGTDAITRRNVAIKVFFTGASLQKDARGELDVTAKLSREDSPSPYLVQIMGVTRLPDHRMALVMEYVDNSPLWDHLHEKEEKLSWENAMSVSGQIIEGVTYLHDRGITHGDLKSANILLTSDFRVKICDYGLAKVASSTRAVGSTRPKSTQTHVGTQAYRAPELFKDKKARPNPQTDMYSLSIVMYEMITRLKPFHDTDGDDMTILPLLLAYMNGLSQDDPFAIPELAEDEPKARKDFQQLYLPIFNECRVSNPQTRPTAAALSQRLRVN